MQESSDGHLPLQIKVEPVFWAVSWVSSVPIIIICIATFFLTVCCDGVWKWFLDNIKYNYSLIYLNISTFWNIACILS